MSQYNLFYANVCLFYVCFYASVCTLRFMRVHVGPYYNRYNYCGVNKRYIPMSETVHMRCRENKGHGVKIIARNRYGGCLSLCEVAVYGVQSEWNKQPCKPKYRHCCYLSRRIIFHRSTRCRLIDLILFKYQASNIILCSVIVWWNGTHWIGLLTFTSYVVALKFFQHYKRSD